MNHEFARGLQAVLGGKVDGLQVGLLNIASESDVSVGLVNINYDRPLYLSTWADELGMIRLTLGLPLGERFALYGGVSANMLASEPNDNSGQVLSFADTGFARRVDAGGTADVWAWPGFFFGMRL